ncbi:hypothetical protein [Sphingomonas sp. LT1P40]|uniref:hypothetical protein n=1 Tax=Alteristakelama amylovorans TaxID=3096166 RepID=UPI002FCAB3E0
MNNPAAYDAARESDARYFRARARDERRRVRHAASERARRIHDEMAEHYETVAALLDGNATDEPRSLAASLRAMLQRLKGS